MALPFQRIDIPIGTGIDEDTHQFLIPPIKMQSASNARYRKTGAVAKRYGYEQLTQPSGQPRRLLSFAGTLYTICDDATGVLQCIGYSPTDDDWRQSLRFLYGTQVPAVRVVRRDRVSTDALGNLFDADATVVNGYRIVVWYAVPLASGVATDPVIRALVIDDASGTVVVSERTISTVEGGFTPKIVPISDTEAIVVYASAVTIEELRSVVFDTATLTWGTDATLVDNFDDSAADLYDIADVGGSPRAWMLAYRNDDSDVEIRRFEETTQTHSDTIAEDPTCIGVFGTAGTGEETWVGWRLAATGVRVAAWTTTDLTAVLAATTLDATTSPTLQNISFQRVSATQAYVAYTFSGQSGTPGSRPFVRTALITQAGVITGPTTRNGIVLHSKLYKQPIGDFSTNRFQAVARYNSVDDTTDNSPQASLFVLDVGDSAAASRLFSSNAQLGRAECFQSRSNSALAHVTQLGANSDPYFAFSPVHTLIEKNGKPASAGVAGVGCYRLSYADGKRFANATLGRALYIAGGVLMFVDGVMMAEVGFHQPPDSCTMALTAAGGSLSAGDYQFMVVYEYVTIAGEREFSTPTLCRVATTNATSITVAANDRVTIRIQHNNITRKHSSDLATTFRTIVAHVYRTEANGTIFYLDTRQDAQLQANSPETNTPITYISSQADSTIRNNALLYTTGGRLEHVNPPPCTIIAAHKNRLFLVSDEDPKTIWYSQAYVEGEIPGFNEVLQIRIEDAHGGITGLASLDDKLIAFSDDGPTRAWVIYGDGPDDKGENNSFSEPQRVNTEQGCADWRSIAIVPAGVIRRSGTDFYLLSRQLQDSFIGAEIRDTAATVPVTKNAIVLPDESEARWYCTDTPESIGKVLVFDYRVGAWIVDSVTSGSEVVVSDTPFMCAVMHDGTAHVGLGGNASVISETTAWTDPDSNAIVTELITSWIKASGIQGFQRVRNIFQLLEHKGAHALDTELRFNYQTASNTEVHSWTASEGAALTPYQPRIHVGFQKHEAVQLRITDSFSGSGTEGFVLTGIALDVGIIPTRMRTAEAHTR